MRRSSVEVSIQKGWHPCMTVMAHYSWGINRAELESPPDGHGSRQLRCQYGRVGTHAWRLPFTVVQVSIRQGWHLCMTVPVHGSWCVNTAGLAPLHDGHGSRQLRCQYCGVCAPVELLFGCDGGNFPTYRDLHIVLPIILYINSI